MHPARSHDERVGPVRQADRTGDQRLSRQDQGNCILSVCVQCTLYNNVDNVLLNG